MTAIILHGDARHLPLPDESVDAIVCDPPYSLPGGFMGRDWDRHDSPQAFGAWCLTWATEALRVLKPGGHLLAFGGTKTWHRLASAVEDAGFEIRDSIAWIYGSGYPKSLDVGRAVDQSRAAGAEMDKVRAWLNVQRIAAGMSLADVNNALGWAANGGGQASAWMTNPTSKNLPNWGQWCALKALLQFGDEMDGDIRKLHEIAAGDDRPVVGSGYRIRNPSMVQVAGLSAGDYAITGAVTTQAQTWAGWGTALKPAFEPIVVGRKPTMGTVAANVLTYGTGALNVDACRVGEESRVNRAGGSGSLQRVSRVSAGYRPTVTTSEGQDSAVVGRWPANVLLDDTAAALLDEQTGTLTSGANPTRRNSDKFRNTYGDFKGQQKCEPARGADSGGASRFYNVFRYESKASDSERPVVDGVEHETVKPLNLMRWLCRLVARPGGLIVDLFAGSGTTLEAAILEGFDVIGIEREATYLPLIRTRVERAHRRLQPGVAALAGVKPRPELDGQGDLLSMLSEVDA